MSASVPPLPLTSSDTASALRPALLAGLMVVLLAFWPTWPSYVSTWLEMREHAFLVAGFAFWLAWRSRDRQLVPADSHSVAAVPIALLSILWLAGVVLNVRLVHQAAVPMVVLGWVFAVAGWRAALAAIPVVGTFFLVVPFWGGFSPPLQAMTVAANAVVLGLTGIQAKIEGNYIALPSGVFEVADACSGVKYLESGVTIAIVYGLLYLRTWRARAVAVVLAAILSIISNWIRVVGLVIIGHVTKMQSALINDHDTYGWIIFAVTLSLFFVLARRIEAYDDRLAATASPATNEPATYSPRSAFQRLVLPTLAALVGPTLFVLGGAGNAVSSSPDELVDGIAPGAAWRLASSEVVPPQDTATWAPTYVGFDEHRRYTYRSGEGESVEVRVDRLIYLRQSQGKELINSSNRMAEDSIFAGGGLLGPLDGLGRMVNATVVREKGRGRLIWSWYRIGGARTHSAVEGKLLEFGGFLTGNRSAELVAVSTRCKDENCRDAGDTLLRFVTGRDDVSAR